MAILNQNLTASQLPSRVHHAFSGPIGNSILLPAGTSLFRFAGHSNISPWWSQTSQLKDLLISAKASGQHLNQYIRNTTAVLRIWDSDMYNLIIAKLNVAVYAFSGPIASQNEAARYMNPKDAQYKQRFTKPVFFKGGNGQVYIFGLSPGDLTFVVPAGTVNIYDGVDEILDFLKSFHLI